MNSIRKCIIILGILVPIAIICLIYNKVFSCGAVLNKSCYGKIDYENMILTNKNLIYFECGEYNSTCVNIELIFESDENGNCTIIFGGFSDSLYYNVYIEPLIVGNKYPITVDGKCNLLNSYNNDFTDISVYIFLAIGIVLVCIIFCIVYALLRFGCDQMEIRNLNRGLPGYAGHAI